MAMLAEPRRRKRYNILPRGKALYEDDTSFGTKMLEKMGWSKGMGLGAKEDGSQEFVRVRYKNDALGLGYKERDDQWTQHEKGFNGLLLTLNGESASNSNSVIERSNALDEETTTGGFILSKSKQKNEKLKEKISGESLEEKSKQSKARVHYKKFTRGKDLTRYSEKDLANILGRKCINENDGFQSFSAITIDQNNEDVETNNKEMEVDSNFGGVQTTTSGLSVRDYFKQKMENMRNKLKNARESRENLVEVETKFPLMEDATKKTEEVDKKKCELVEEQLEEDKEIPKKKKRKRDKVEKVEDEIRLIDITDDSEKSTKKKKQKRRIESIEGTRVAEADVESIKQVATKKNKKKKQAFEQETIELLNAIENSTNLEHSTKQKKKKAKSKESSNENICKNTVNDNSMEYSHVDKKQLNSMETAGHINKKIAQNVNNESNSIKIEGNKKKKEATVVPKKIPLEEPINAVESFDEDSTDEIIKISRNFISSQNLALMSDKELTEKFNSYNVFTISTFCAEKFRNSDLTRFGGANISHLPGYSFSDNLKLDIKSIRNDEKRIMKFWDCTLKYTNAAPRNTYYKYVKQVKSARKAKLKKQPRFYVKTWKRKQAFQGL